MLSNELPHDGNRDQALVKIGQIIRIEGIQGSIAEEHTDIIVWSFRAELLIQEREEIIQL